MTMYQKNKYRELELRLKFEGITKETRFKYFLNSEADSLPYSIKKNTWHSLKTNPSNPAIILIEKDRPCSDFFEQTMRFGTDNYSFQLNFNLPFKKELFDFVVDVVWVNCIDAGIETPIFDDSTFVEFSIFRDIEFSIKIYV